MAANLTCVLEAQPKVNIIEEVKQAVREAMDNIKADIGASADNTARAKADSAGETVTYASVTAARMPEVRISRGHTLKVPASTAFVIVPDEKNMSKYASSNATREALCKALKPSECALKVNKISNFGKNGIKIEAISLNIEKI